MRINPLKMGLFLVAVTCISGTAKANAQAPTIILASDTSSSIAKQVTDSIKEIEQSKSDATSATDDQQITVITHSVEPGESLTTIAGKYQTTWTRLYDKNTQIQNPNVIAVQDKVTIPGANEQLTPRAIPVDSPPVTQPTQATQPRSAGSKPVAQASRGSSSGNSYSYGYCTWYVKNRRPDMPNNLGNADTWVARAAAQGLATGSVPRAGAVGQRGMHVVYVESVNGDGTITVSEMNFQGYNVVSSRIVPANYFQYIY